ITRMFLRHTVSFAGKPRVTSTWRFTSRRATIPPPWNAKSPSPETGEFLANEPRTPPLVPRPLSTCRKCSSNNKLPPPRFGPEAPRFVTVASFFIESLWDKGLDLCIPPGPGDLCRRFTTLVRHFDLVRGVAHLLERVHP